MELARPVDPLQSVVDPLACGSTAAPNRLFFKHFDHVAIKQLDSHGTVDNSFLPIKNILSAPCSSVSSSPFVRKERLACRNNPKLKISKRTVLKVGFFLPDVVLDPEQHHFELSLSLGSSEIERSNRIVDSQMSKLFPHANKQFVHEHSVCTEKFAMMNKNN